MWICNDLQRALFAIDQIIESRKNAKLQSGKLADWPLGLFFSATVYVAGLKKISI